MIRLAKFLLFCSVLFATRAGLAASKVPQLYRWADEEGHVYYADKIPPQHSKYGRAKLNEQGVTIDVVEKSKSAEEIEREKKLQELREAEELLLQDHLSRDRALLKSFKSEKEIDAAFKAKSSTLEALEKITLSNISRLESQIETLEKQAAEFERNGKPAPQSLVDDIRAYRQQVASNQERIQSLDEQKLELGRKFTEDLERFRALTAPKQTNGRNPESTLEGRENHREAGSIILSVAPCGDARVCKKAWELARIYLIEHSTTQVRIDTDRIIYTSAPERDDDIALSLAKIEGKDGAGAQVFLDVRCKQSGVGREVCAGDQVKGILGGFATYIENGLKIK